MRPHSKTIIALGVFAVMLLVFVAFILFPLFRGIRADFSKVFAAQQELSHVSLYEKQVQAFGELSKTREYDVAVLRNHFIDRHTPIAFIEALEGYSRNSDVSLRITSVESTRKEEDAWDSMDFELVGRGSYPHVLSFVKQLENSPYLLEFKNATMQRLASGEVDFFISVKAYTK